MAHVLSKHRGLCRNIHGHSYQMSVSVGGSVQGDDNVNPAAGMVIDFTDLGDLAERLVLNEFDHSLVMNRAIAHHYLSESGMRDYKVILLDFEPTCENMLLNFVERFRRELPKGVILKSMILRETASSFAEWRAEDAE